MISGLNLSQTIDYTLPEDKENPTVWKLGVIPSYVFAQISSEAKSNEIETTFKLLQVSIKGWENFSIPYETVEEKIYGRITNVVPMSIVERLPLSVITGLSIKIIEINRLSKEEIKN